MLHQSWPGSSWPAWWLGSTGSAQGCSPHNRLEHCHFGEQTWFSHLQLACNWSPGAPATTAQFPAWMDRIFWSNMVPSTRNSCPVILSLTIGGIFQIQTLHVFAPQLIWVWGRYCRTWKEQLQPHLFTLLSSPLSASTKAASRKSKFSICWTDS